MAKERVDRESKRTTGIGVRMNQFEREKAEKLCVKTGYQMSEMIRRLVIKEYNECFSNDENK